MKTFMCALAIPALLLANLSGCSKNNADGKEDSDRFTGEGKVVAIDLEGIALDGPGLITIDTKAGERLIAIPSMGLPLCAGYENIADAFSVSLGDSVRVSGSVDEEGRVVPCESDGHYFIMKTTVIDEAFGLMFNYRKGPDGYVLQNIEKPLSRDVPDLLVSYRLVARMDAENQQGMESPPAITVSVFENLEKQSASMWVDAHPAISHIDRASGEIARDETLAGANAVRFVADGLYASNVVVVAHGGFIYRIVGEFNDLNTTLYKDFEPFLDAIKFIPPLLLKN